ncbi:MAG: FHA domain-containing protein [Hyphomicrobiaceae bacterium]
MTYILSWRKTTGGSGSRSMELTPMRAYSIGRSTTCDIVLDDESVSRHHANVEVTGTGVAIHDNASSNGLTLAGLPVTSSRWIAGQPLLIGDFELVLEHNDDTQVTIASPDVAAFPPLEMERNIVDVAALAAGGQEIEERDYVALGGGIGSFVWVDHLRIFGVEAASIRAIGDTEKPYQKYADLCANSQIPDAERLRSNSLSVPDNIWGFPGYASRETWRELLRGNLDGIKYIMQVFGEPTLAESYTPRAGDVYRSMDSEAERIGWRDIWRRGRILKIRKTNDGRYAVAYRVPVDRDVAEKRDRIVVGRTIHLSTGYPAARFLPDLQQFKNASPSSLRVVNAYEPHDSVYDDLEKNGGTILVRGRGIVASRIVQRASEARAKNPDIRILHVMRSPIKEGRQFDFARRIAAHDIEYQPFNWPKACWGGTLRQRLESATPDERAELMSSWGGTTTADRTDWEEIIEEGKKQGWYRPFFGDVTDIALADNGICTTLMSNLEFKEAIKLDADYVIDCTGLIADLEASPLLADLIETYALARNRAGQAGPETRLAGLTVTNQFEVEGMRNDTGRFFAAGIITQNGPYAAVDSFLGLQYAALRSVRSLASGGAEGVTAMGPLRSAFQWLKWCTGSKP